MQTRYRAYLVGFGLIYTLCFCVALPAFIDEAYTYNLATDSRLTHMLSALRDGADGAFPAYPLFAFGWVKLFGSSELSLRLTAGVFVILLVWQCGGCLLRRFGPTAAVVGLLCMLANEKFIFYTIQARFYALVLLMFSVVFWSGWEMIRDKAVSGRRRLWHGIACGLLCLTHPLAVVYAAILALLYVGFSYWRRTFSLANAASYLGGPLFLLAWLPSFLVQRRINTVFPPGATVPGLAKYWEYAFLDSKVLFAVVLIGAVLLTGAKWLCRSRTQNAVTGTEATLPQGEANHADNTLLVVYAVAFIVLLNVTVAVLDAAHVIPIYLMLAVRYVLVAIVAYAVVAAWIWEGLEQLLRRASAPRIGQLDGASHPQVAADVSRRIIPAAKTAPTDVGGYSVSANRAGFGITTLVGRMVWVLALAGLLVSMAFSWSRWMVEKSYLESTLARLSVLARDKHLGIVCEDYEPAFYLSQRAGATDVKYLLAENCPFRTLLLCVQRHYPQPQPVSMAEFRQFTNDFVLLPSGKPPVIIHQSAALAR